MKISSVKLNSPTLQQLRTDILYSIASFRAQGMELVELIVSDTAKEKLENGTLKVLKEQKKQGSIRAYALAREISGESCEAEYLLNKYPDLSLYNEKENSIIVLL